MDQERAFDVLVIGAGPAGSAAAFHLASAGRSVLLVEQHSFPRDKACGDGLTRASLKLLAEMDLSDRLRSHHRVHGIRVGTDTSRYQDRYYGADYGVVIPRTELDQLICRQAVKAGASLLEKTLVVGPILENGRVSGAQLRVDGVEREVLATFVIAADGANSCFARRVGLFSPDPWSRGFAVRGYFTNVVDVEALFKVYVPLIDPDENRALGGYGWVFPLPGENANIGVGFFPTQQRDFGLNLRRVFEHFLVNLRQTDPRLERVRLVGSLRGGPLPCGLNPANCAGKGVLLVGDAAGLVDPFTGEGINTALESGKLAAKVLDAALASSNPKEASLTGYSRLLEERYRERYRIGKKFVKTYGFMWKLLENTFDIERPLFSSIRQFLIDFGNINGNDNHSSLTPAQFKPALEELALLDDLRNVEERITSVMNKEFPLLSKVSSNLADANARFLRTTLICLPYGCAPVDPRAKIAAATSIELACLANLMHENILDGPESKHHFPHSQGNGGVNWGNMFAVMAGNYLLSKAYDLTTELGCEISQIVSCACAEGCIGRMWEIDASCDGNVSEDRYYRIAEKKTATVYELCCQLGARLNGTPQDIADALTMYGHNLGMAYHLVSDFLQAETPLRDRAWTLSKASSFLTIARDCLTALPPNGVRQLLYELCDFVIELVPSDPFIKSNLVDEVPYAFR